MIFCTVSDDKHFPLLLNLIGSIHKHNFNQLKEIMVYDLGLKEEYLNTLKNTKKLKIYKIEETNPYIFKDIQTDQNRYVKGLFSWKPVIIKQALDLYEEVLYIDAGTVLLKPIDNIFKHINQNGYLFFDCGHSIKWMTTKSIIEKFELQGEKNKWLLNEDTLGVDAGLQGISRKVYNEYVVPMYELSKDINNFVDDGSCPNGWGTGRHDQTLFSILAQKLKYKILKHGSETCYLNVDGKPVLIHVVHLPQHLKSETDIFRSRWSLHNREENINSIRFEVEKIDKSFLKKDFEKYTLKWEDSFEINDEIYYEFEQKVDEYEFLKKHFEIVNNYALGYGEKSFWYLWLLLFSELANDSKFLEIGVYKGSILSLSQLCAKKLNKSINSYGITPLENIGDKYSNYEKSNYLENIKYLFSMLNVSGNKTQIIKGLSTNEKIKNETSKHGPFDMIYIDGGHDYETVVNDIDFAKNNLKTNGYLIMDDASSFLKITPNNTRFNGHADVAFAIKNYLDNDDQYKHVLACGHNRVWQRMQPNKI